MKDKKIKISVSISNYINDFLENNHINKSKLIDDLLFEYYNNNREVYEKINIKNDNR